MSTPPNLVLITPHDDEPIDQAIARSLTQGESPFRQLPALTNVVLGDPFLAEQLAALRQQFELRPPSATGLIGRVRVRLAWWLLGAEITQINQNQARMVRILDSLIVLIDQERAARRRLEERE
ncbi:MAG: hypothetical protein Fur005_19660 [Roseiflexaceae bacterium]